LGLPGKGKRRRSCDEEEEGERKAKRQKQEGGSSEVLAVPSWQGWHHIPKHLLGQPGGRCFVPLLPHCSASFSSFSPFFFLFFVAFSSFFKIFRSLPAGYNISRPVLDQYLALLADDPLEFVGKAGDSGGGTYTVSILGGLGILGDLRGFWGDLFGSRCARIFRLLLRKKHLEQKQVEDFAMIPAKEAKDMLYRMLSENLVALQEIPKTPDHAPSRTFYLYTVNVMAAARMLLHRCYKSVANLMERRQHEMRENKRLLEKSQRVEAILASMQATGAEAAQLHEVEEMITGPERQQLESLKRNVNKIDASENQVDETIFVLESFIESTMKRP
ncbi:RPC3 polymerase, partial [Motacilla alba]|nr:RPC3 polymerase [Motacilla alba]